MSREELEKLPMLLSRKVFKQVTGLTDDNIRQLLAAGGLRVTRLPGATRAKYPKSEAIRLAGGA